MTVRKILFGVAVILTIIILFLGFGFVIDYLKDLAIVTKYSLDNEDGKKSSLVTFLDVPENADIINAALSINNSFLNEKPFDTNYNDKELLNSSSIYDDFSSFKSYYFAKLKIETAVYERLNWLYSAILGMDEDKLLSYFNSNSDYIDKYWGITSFEEFRDFTNTILNLNGSSVKSCAVTSSGSYALSNTIYFRIMVETKEGSYIYLNVSVSPEKSSKNQAAPLIKINGSVGGIS